MSLRAYESVWEEASEKGGALLVLLALADHADRDSGVAWPSAKTLADMSGLEKRQVGRILEQLDGRGKIDRWHYRDGRRWVAVFRLTVGPYANQRGIAPLEAVRPGPPPTRRQNVASTEGAFEATSEPVRGDISDGLEATFPLARLEEPSLEPSVNPAPAKPARKRDEIWDALVEEIRASPETKSERGRWNAAVKQLREAGATAEDVKTRASAYQKRWPDASLTPTALAANWGSLAPKTKPVPSCSDCGIGGGRHSADCPVIAPFTDSDVRRVAEQIKEHRE